MVETIWVSIVPRTPAQFAARNRFRNKLDSCRMAPTSRWDDADAIVRHLVRVQNLMQCYRCYGGLGDNNLLRARYMERSLIKVPRLRNLFLQCYSRSHMDYRRSIRFFLNDLDKLGVSYPKGSEGMVLRSGKAIRALNYGWGRDHLHGTFTPQMRDDVFSTFPVRVRRDNFKPKNFE